MVYKKDGIENPMEASPDDRGWRFFSAVVNLEEPTKAKLYKITKTLFGFEADEREISE